MAAVEQLITSHLDLWTAAIRRKSTAGRGISNKIELYGINKLRELILELAVSGLLVPQDPNDKPASELLKRIAVEKAKLVEEGKIKQGKALPQISEEGLQKLPPGWAWTCLAALGEIAPRNAVADDIIVSFIPMPLISTRIDGRHGHEPKKWAEIKKGYTHFANGDIAIAKITPCFENSKAAIFSELHNGVGAGTTELHVARPYGDFVSRSFLLLYLKSPQFLQVGETRMTGSAGQKRVPTGYFSFNPLPLPPQPEQCRIVAKVDELMALCDQLEQQTDGSLSAHQTLVEILLSALTSAADHAQFASSWQRISEHFDALFTTEESIDQLKQTTLQLAVMGKLVPQDPNDEPASEPLKRIGINPQHHVLTGWSKVSLGQLGDILGGATPSKSNAEYWTGNIPWVSPKDMKRSFIADAEDHVSELAISNSSLKKIPSGSLLMVVRGMILAHSFPVAITECEVTINQDMKALVIPREFGLYLLVYMQAMKQEFVTLVDRSSHGTCKLVSEKLWSYPVLLPPLAEQHRIVAKVDELMVLCDQLKSCLVGAQNTQLHLADAMIEQALAEV